MAIGFVFLMVFDRSIGVMMIFLFIYICLFFHADLFIFMHTFLPLMENSSYLHVIKLTRDEPHPLAWVRVVCQRDRHPVVLLNA